MHVIPAIDIIDGSCVRLSEGDYNRKTVYSEDPLEIAKKFESAGLKRLHLVDLDGAKQKKVVNLNVLQRIAQETKLTIDFGGGVQSTEDLQKVFDAGASQITGGSVAVRNPKLFEEWLSKFGPERIILGADVKDGKVAISGWQEQSQWDLLAFIAQYYKKGVRQVICTDVSKDGLLKGPAVALYKQLVDSFPEVSFIASGGVSNYGDLSKLKQTGVTGAIVGKAIYEGKVTLEELKGL